MVRNKKTRSEDTQDTEVTAVRKSPRKRPIDDPPDSKTPPTDKKPKVVRGRTKGAGKQKVHVTQTANARFFSDDSPSIRGVKDYVQKNANNNNNESLGEYGIGPSALELTEEDILSIDSTGKLYGVLKGLLRGSSDEMFDEYKKTAKERIQLLEEERDHLQNQLLVKQNTIDTLAMQIQELQSNASAPSVTPKKPLQQMYESPIRKKSSAAMIRPGDMEEELKTISFTFDMLELLTGVRVINYEEDKEKFYFDIRQTDTAAELDRTPVAIEYRLVIKRRFDQTAEVTYIPVFLKNMMTTAKASDDDQKVKNEHAKLVEANLPEYLRENLKFPFNTLLQFYAKLVRALNKSGKSR